MNVLSTSTTPANAASKAKSAEDTKLRQTCQDMESVFTTYLLKSMRSTVQKSDLFGSDEGESMFQDMLDGEVAKVSAKQNGTGMAEMLYQQLSKLQNVSNPLQPSGTQPPLALSRPEERGSYRSATENRPSFDTPVARALRTSGVEDSHMSELSQAQNPEKPLKVSASPVEK